MTVSKRVDRRRSEPDKAGSRRNRQVRSTEGVTLHTTLPPTDDDEYIRRLWRVTVWPGASFDSMCPTTSGCIGIPTEEMREPSRQVAWHEASKSCGVPWALLRR